MSVFNMYFFAICAAAFLAEKNTSKFPFFQSFAVLGLVGAAGFSFALSYLPNLNAVALLLSGAYFIQEATLSSERRATPSIAAALGAAPLLVAQAGNTAGIIIVLFLIEGCMLLNLWRRQRENLPKQGLSRKAVLTLPRVFTMSLALFFSVVNHEVDASVYGYSYAGSSLGEIFVWISFALLYSGVFLGLKDESRNQKALKISNPVWHILYSYFLPSFFFSRALFLMENLDFVVFQQTAVFILAILAASAFSQIWKAWRAPEVKEPLIRFYFLWLLAISLFRENFAGLPLQAASVFLGCFVFWLLFTSGSKNSKLAKFTHLLAIPSPYSVLLWVFMWLTAGYTGAGAFYLTMFGSLLGILGLFLYNEKKGSFLPIGREKRIKINPVGIAILTCFVVPLFIDKIAL